MADANETEIQFVPEQGEDDFEVAVLRDGETPPKDEPVAPVDDGKKVLTAEEFAALQQKTDATAALTQGLASLAEQMGQRPAPVNVPVPEAEVDPSQLEADLFAAGKSVPTIEKIVQKQLGGLQGQILQGMILQGRQMLQINPKTTELFGRYEKEIEQVVAGAPPQLRMQANIYEQAYNLVVQRHQADIIEAEVQKRVKAAQDAAAGEAGKSAAKRTPMQNEVGSLGPAAVKPKAKVYLTVSDVQEMRDSGLDAGDKEQVRAWLANKKAKGR